MFQSVLLVLLISLISVLQTKQIINNSKYDKRYFRKRRSSNPTCRHREFQLSDNSCKYAYAVNCGPKMISLKIYKNYMNANN